jgi:hypothetical protein
VALQSQESERVVAFLNAGGGNFRQEKIYAAPHPRWGSTGIRLVDLDADGDLDIVSSVFIPRFDPRWLDAGPLETVVWLEQTSPGQFRRYFLETDVPVHPCGDLGDFDGDGDLDIVLGNFILFPSKNETWTSCITVLENRSGSGGGQQAAGSRQQAAGSRQ